MPNSPGVGVDMGSPELAVLIPAYNESRSIGGLVKQLSGCAQVVVVDDGSTDNTADLASRAGAKVVSLSLNQGYDSALASGLEYLMQMNYRGFATCDADGQHQASDVERVLSRISENTVIVGARASKARFSEKIFAYVSKPLWGISDPLCGLKGYSLDNLPEDACTYFAGTTGTGLAIGLVSRGSRVENIRIDSLPREHGRSKFGSMFRSNVKIVSSLVLAVWRHFLLVGRLQNRTSHSQRPFTKSNFGVDTDRRKHGQ